MILLLSFSHYVYANTPTEALEVSVNKILLVAKSKANDKAKKEMLTEVLKNEIDFEVVSKRIISKKWKIATEEQKKQFKELFLSITSDTYFTLLKNYSNEKVEYTKEQIKNNKYSIVDTLIITEDNKIPVRYRLYMKDGNWKIYDFIPEGVSFVTTYKNNYAVILNKSGMQGLLEEMVKSRKEKAEQADVKQADAKQASVKQADTEQTEVKE